VVPPPEAPDPNADPNLYAGNWSQRPRDVAIFTRWMSDATERKLNWQVISSKATVDDFHDAPVLYLAGNQKLTLPRRRWTRFASTSKRGPALRAGGLRQQGIYRIVHRAGEQMFRCTSSGRLPADHPIYTRQQFLRKNWKKSAQRDGAVERHARADDYAAQRRHRAELAAGDVPGKEETFQVMNGIVLYAVDRAEPEVQGWDARGARRSGERRRGCGAGGARESRWRGWIRGELEPGAGGLATLVGDPSEAAAGSDRRRAS